MSTVALGRRPVESDILRELRHVQALAAREVTLWLLQLEGARKSPRTRSEYTRILDGLLAAYPDHGIGDFTDDDCFTYDVLRWSVSQDAHFDRPREPDEDEAAALTALGALVDAATERELREHGPGCRCRLALALSAANDTRYG